VTEPTEIFAEEPTGNLDTARSHENMDLLIGLNRDRDVTIVMVTHEHEMAAYAKRVVYFLDGLVESDIPNGRKS
jgi:putative ABC transport system ATP-binding protein